MNRQNFLKPFGVIGAALLTPVVPKNITEKAGLIDVHLKSGLFFPVTVTKIVFEEHGIAFYYQDNLVAFVIYQSLSYLVEDKNE